MSENRSESQGSDLRLRIFTFSTVWVIRLLRCESAILIVLALYTAVAALVRDVSSKCGVIGEIIFALVGAIGLYISSLGYQQKKSFGRAPAVLANLIALGVSYFMYSGHAIGTAIPLSIIASLTLACALLSAQEL
jgi:uncharacterized membrane-anchored protein